MSTRWCNDLPEHFSISFMSSASTNLRLQILRHALPLIKSHGFTRQALASAVLSLPNHSEPLSDTAVSSLFGSGDSARSTLISYWLEEARNDMSIKKGASIGAILKHRLQRNEPVLSYLPEVRLRKDIQVVILLKLVRYLLFCRHPCLARLWILDLLFGMQRLSQMRPLICPGTCVME